MNQERDQFINSLRSLGLDGENYPVLKLLPLVYVAWADGVIDAAERERIITLAREHYGLEASGISVLGEWLDAQPPSGYIQKGIDLLLGLALAPDELIIGADDLQEIMVHAEAIARATADSIHAPWALKPEEEIAIEQLAHEMHVDSGTTWNHLLAELDSSVSWLLPAGKAEWPTAVVVPTCRHGSPLAARAEPDFPPSAHPPIRRYVTALRDGGDVLEPRGGLI
jgi:hypothetical protein